MSYNHAPINTFLLNHRGNRPFPSYPRVPGTQVKQDEPRSCSRGSTHIWPRRRVSVIVNTHHILWWSTAHGKNEPGWGMGGLSKNLHGEYRVRGWGGVRVLCVGGWMSGGLLLVQWVSSSAASASDGSPRKRGGEEVPVSPEDRKTASNLLREGEVGVWSSI